MKYILYVLLFIFICVTNINHSITNVDFNNKIKISCACDKNKKNKKINNKTLLPIRKRSDNIIQSSYINNKHQHKNSIWIKLKMQNNILSNTKPQHKNIPDITNRKIKRI